MQTIDVLTKDTGKIWHRKPSVSNADGLLLTITRSSLRAFSPATSRTIPFVKAVFDRSGQQFLAGDQQGKIYQFNLDKNKFSLLFNAGIPCTALAFDLQRKNEALIALSDCMLKCYDIATRELVCWMKGHDTAVHSISVHESGRYALTTSTRIAHLWDLETFTHKRTLNGAQRVGILKVCFLPSSNSMLTCFKDDTIFVWNLDTLQCDYQLPLPPGKKPHYRTLAATRDGRFLIAGGKSGFLHLWTLEGKRLIRVIQLPSQVKVVKVVDFLPDSLDTSLSQTVGVLSQDGIMRFINIHTCKLLFEIGTKSNPIHYATISSHGRFILAIMQSGNINIYNVASLYKDIKKPPDPVANIVTAEHTATISNNDSNTAIDISTKDDLRGFDANTITTINWNEPQNIIHHKPDMWKRAGSATVPNRRKPQVKQQQLRENLYNKLDRKKLYRIVKGFNEYPSKYRMFIWRSLLELPENHTSYSNLVNKGMHSSYLRLDEEYPIKSRKLQKNLQQCLSALAHWSPIFGEVNYLPLLVFPFVKIFQNNQLICFEVVATIIANWCQEWFEFFPNPPINILSIIEKILGAHDSQLLQHFVKYGIKSQTYAWPLLETLFSEVLTKDDWLQLWDHILTNHPSFLLLAVVAYLLCSRRVLLHCTEKEDFEYYFHHRNAVDMNGLIREAYRIQDTTVKDLHPKYVLESFQPLTSEQYPIFNKYPKFIVNYQVNERERILQEEMEYLKERQIASEVKRDAEQRIREEEAWYRHQQLLTEAEEQRRKTIRQEEEKLGEQKLRLQAMKREISIKELQLLDAARRKLLHNEQLQRENELSRLDQELAKLAKQREEETRNAVADMEIKAMELRAQKEMFMQELARERAKDIVKYRADFDAKRKEGEVQDYLAKRERQATEERITERRQTNLQRLAKAQQKAASYKTQYEFDYRNRMQRLEQEMQHLTLDHRAQLNKIDNDEVEVVMKEIENNAQNATRMFRDELINRQKDNKENRDFHDDESNSMCIGNTGRRSTEVTSIRLNDATNITQQSSHDVNRLRDDERKNFEKQELQLLADVRKLRSKIAAANKQLHGQELSTSSTSN